VVFVFIVVASVGAYRFFSGDDFRYEFVNGRLIRIDPYGNRTPLGPPADDAKDQRATEQTPALRPDAIGSNPPPDNSSRPKAPAANPPPQDTPAVPRAHFTEYDNRDLNGGDLGAPLRNTSYNDCVAACLSNARCRAYSFDKWNRFCFLKSDIQVLRLDVRSLTGILDGAPKPSVSTTTVGMEHYRGKAFPGSGYKTLTTGTPASCETACTNEDTCVAYTFRKPEKLCTLFRTTGEYFSNSSAESGGRQQEP
jgi:hypothetical protein